MATPPDLWAEAAETLQPDDRFPIDSSPENPIQEVLLVVKRRRDECLVRRWRYKNSKGEVLILRDVFAKTITWIEKFIQIGDVAVQYDPVHSSLPWAGVRFLLQVAVNDAQTMGAMTEGLEAVTNLIVRCKVLEMLYLGKASAIEGELSKAIVKLYTAILVFLSKAAKYYEQNTISKDILLRKHVRADLHAERVGKSVLKSPEAGVEQYLDAINKAQKDVDTYTNLVAAKSKSTYLSHEASSDYDHRA
jgi:hypothetical protein